MDDFSREGGLTVVMAVVGVDGALCFSESFPGNLCPEHTGEEGGEEGAPVLVFSVQEGSSVRKLAPQS